MFIYDFYFNIYLYMIISDITKIKLFLKYVDYIFVHRLNWFKLYYVDNFSGHLEAIKVEFNTSHLVSGRK